MHESPASIGGEKFNCTDRLKIIPDADLFLSGILQSSVHMAWTKTFCGKVESRFNYSVFLIYNNFPFPEVTKNLRDKISATAQLILDCRKKYSSNAPESPTTLADLYDYTILHKDLKNDHKANDKAVMAAYGFDKNFSEAEIIAELMKLYKKF